MADTPTAGPRFTAILAVYGAGLFLSRGLVFLLLPLLTNRLSPAEFGVYALLQSLYLVFTVLLLHGMDEAVIRFSNNPIRYPRAFASALCAVAAAGLAITALCGLALTRLTAFESLAPTDALLFGTWLLTDTLAYLSAARQRAQEKPLSVGAALVFSALLQFVFVYLFVFLKQEGLHGLLKSHALSGLLTLGLWIPFILRERPGTPAAATWRSMAAFGWPLMTAALLYALINNMDRWILNRWFGDTETGLYGLAFRLGMGALLLLNAFKFGWYPRFYGRMEKEGRDAGNLLGRKTLSLLLPLVGSAGLFIALFIPEIAAIRISGKSFIGPDFWPAFPVVAPVALAFVYDAAVTVADSTLYYEQRVRRILVCVAAAVVCNLLLNLLLIPRFGLTGAALSLAGTYALLLVAVHAMTVRTLGIRPLTAEAVVLLLYFSFMLLFPWQSYGFQTRALLFCVHTAVAGIYLYKRLRSAPGPA